MLNENVLLTTLKNNFDNVLDRVDEKIDNALPCYKKETEILKIPLADILAMPEVLLINVDTINLSVGEDYILSFCGYTLRATCFKNEETGTPSLDYVDNKIRLYILDKYVYDYNSSSNIADETKAVVSFEYLDKAPTTDLILKKVVEKKIDADLLPSPIDLVVENSISIGRESGSNIGEGSSAIGSNVEASGNNSHAEGNGTTANGECSHAEGSGTTANGECSHAEGVGTTASGHYSHAEGGSTTASSGYSHAEGSDTISSGYYSHAEGNSTTASGECSHTEGAYTKALGEYQHVQGKYNIEDTENKYAHIVGNGTSSTARSNAHTLDWEGNAWFAGDVFVGGSDNSSAEKLVTKSYVEEFATKANGIKDVIALKDQVTGENYFLQIRNGVLVTSLMPAGIQLKTSPTKTIYYEGDCFEISDIELELVNADGTTSLIEDVDNISTVQEYMTLDMTFVTIKYNYIGFDFTVDIPITVNEFDPAVVLIDFYYTDNGNGTYTITDWKGTKDGVSSTELVIPNNNKIIL